MPAHVSADRLDAPVPLAGLELEPLVDRVGVGEGVVGGLPVAVLVRGPEPRHPCTPAGAPSLAIRANRDDRDGYRPGKFWAPAISLTQLVAGPLLALGLLTRLAALPIFLFLLVTNVERWRIGKYFWNQLGLEYTLMWTIATFYFLVHGGGRISLDHLLGRAF